MIEKRRFPPCLDIGCHRNWEEAQRELVDLRRENDRLRALLPTPKPKPAYHWLGADAEG